MTRRDRIVWRLVIAFVGGTIGLPLAHHVQHARHAEHLREADHALAHHHHDHGEPPGAPHGEDSPLHGALHVLEQPAAPVVDLRFVLLAIRPMLLPSQPGHPAPQRLPFPRGPPALT